MRRFTPAWENYTKHPSEEKKTHVSLKGITLEQMDGLVKKVGLSNQERSADAIRIADGHSFLAACPWFNNTKSNRAVVDRWLHSKGITNSTFPDVVEATEELAKAGLIDVDGAAFAQYLDNGPRGPFKGKSGKTYESLDSLIAQEREIALHTIEPPSDLEAAFDALPLEEQRQMLTDALNTHQAVADRQITEQNASSWITLHPEFRDDTYNGKLMAAQLKLNGVTGVVTIEDYEIAERQLVKAGLVRQNPAQLRKQEAAEVLDRAKRAVETPGSIFDETSEADMYNLPMDELRRRAAGNYTGSDRL